MRIRWILTNECAADIERLLGRRVPLAELRTQLHIPANSTSRWRAGQLLHRIYVDVIERRDGDTLVRELVEAHPPHEGWAGPPPPKGTPFAPGRRPTRDHRQLAQDANRAGGNLSPSDVRDMDPDARDRLALRVWGSTRRPKGTT